MPGAVMPKTDAQYQIESDARTLVEAEMIKRDSKRYEAAVKHIEKENEARKSAIQK